ncbi:hypothetical protein OPKNFCMD_4027 [Methylobacterium crusticola]|uniref:NUDIX hydrolase n=1 Tax=Methylobacterium crusticola TaxID=1697972 RepID=A0ABQ4R328_9HYPH|nr:hypothetical protein [Methylobacterium crusticola]GJD51274.1 hypothetical protein OPKNFCMD_4027 [Methylobacterium crusticola]
MSLHRRPVQVATGGGDTERRLVSSDGFLVAVLVRRSDRHGAEAGTWFPEAGRGRVDDPVQPTFPDPAEAQAWIACRLAGA